MRIGAATAIVAAATRAAAARDRENCICSAVSWLFVCLVAWLCVRCRVINPNRYKVSQRCKDYQVKTSNRPTVLSKWNELKWDGIEGNEETGVQQRAVQLEWSERDVCVCVCPRWMEMAGYITLLGGKGAAVTVEGSLHVYQE